MIGVKERRFPWLDPGNDASRATNLAVATDLLPSTPSSLILKVFLSLFSLFFYLVIRRMLQSTKTITVGITFAADGTMYFVDGSSIRMVDSSGKISTWFSQTNQQIDCQGSGKVCPFFPFLSPGLFCSRQLITESPLDGNAMADEVGDESGGRESVLRG